MNAYRVSSNVPAPCDPRAVANYILDACDLGGVRDMSNMKLQKLLYLAHREHLGVFGGPLLKLGFEAWEHGPVSPIVYQSFKNCGSRAIDGRATMIDLMTGQDVIVVHDLPKCQEEIMDVTLARFGRSSASALRALTHTAGGAWDVVWQRRLTDRSGTTMSDQLIVTEHERQVLERRVHG